MSMNMKTKPIIHPYFYLSETPKFEKMTYAELGFIHADGREITPIYRAKRDDKTYLLGSSGSRLYISDDDGKSWKRILDAGLGNGRVEIAFMTSHPNINKSIVFVGGDSKVYQSTDLDVSTIDSWNEVISDLPTGYFSSKYGWSVNERIIVLSTYGSRGGGPEGDNPPRFIYLSRNWGETFQEIEMQKVSDMENPETFHIHDVEYDPYSSRIWVATGDQHNSNVWYSDDWGASFERVYAHDSRTTQPTGIHALPDRVIFTSDDQPNGVKVWHRNRYELKAKVKPEDIKLIFTPDTFISERFLRNVAQLPSVEFRNLTRSYPYNILLPFSAAASSEKTSRILATPNGEDYFELFRSDYLSPSLAKATINRLVPPLEDGQYAYVTMYDPSEGSFIVRFKMPKWNKVN